MKNLALSYFRTFKMMGLMLLSLSCSMAWAQQTQPMLPPPPPTVSTVPPTGDVNPNGAAFAPAKFVSGFLLQPYDLLVSNFNNAQNLPGTGSTVTRVDAGGHPSPFYQGPSGLGLTGALGVVRDGLVFVGRLPTADGTSATAQPGSLLVLDGNGNQIANLANSNFISGPWGMAIEDLGSSAHIFVSNVLAGTITRLDVSFPSVGAIVVHRMITVGSGFSHRTDPAALVLGPSGLAFDAKNDILYVASSVDNAIYALSGAALAKASLGSGTLVYQDFTHLHGPTQMAWTPNGHLLVANSDGSNIDPNQPSEIVEFTTAGQFVSQFSIDANNGGAFAVALEPIGILASRVAAVDVNANSVTTFTEMAH